MLERYASFFGKHVRMKIIVLLLFWSASFGVAEAQRSTIDSFNKDDHFLLEGEWEGTFSIPQPNLTKYCPIKVQFILDSSGVYKAFSYSSFLGIVSVCSLNYSLKGKKLYLEETQFINHLAIDSSYTRCLQQMDLHIKRNKKKLKMAGYWKSLNPNCGSGSVKLYKNF